MKHVLLIHLLIIMTGVPQNRDRVIMLSLKPCEGPGTVPH